MKSTIQNACTHSDTAGNTERDPLWICRTRTRKLRTPSLTLCTLSIIPEDKRIQGPPMNKKKKKKTPRGPPSKYTSYSQNRNTSTRCYQNKSSSCCMSQQRRCCASSIKQPQQRMHQRLRRYNTQDTTCTAHTNSFRSGALYVGVVPSTFISLFVGKFSIKNEVNRSKILDGGASQIFGLKIEHDPSHGRYGTGGKTHVRTRIHTHTTLR
jgi:hypothetical protein